jgi:hypothetical protein
MCSSQGVGVAACAQRNQLSDDCPIASRFESVAMSRCSRAFCEEVGQRTQPPPMLFWNICEGSRHLSKRFFGKLSGGGLGAVGGGGLSVAVDRVAEDILDHRLGDNRIYLRSILSYR